MASVFTRYVSSKAVKSSITKTLRPILLVKTKDILNYFKRPEVLQEIPNVHYIKKDEIINVTKSFKKTKDNPSTEFADLSIKKDYFMCQKDAKKRMLIITAKLDKPSSNQDDFDTHAIVEEYEVKPIEGIKPPNVEFESSELVDDIKDMNGILINFVRYYHETKLITMNEKTQTFGSNASYITEERKNALGLLNSRKYVHLLDNNIRASLHDIEVKNNNSMLQEFHNLGFLQIYSQKKQPLKSIDEIIAKMKSGDFGEDFSIKNLSDLLDDPNLEMIDEGRLTKYNHNLDSNENDHYELIRGGNGDLICKRFLFDLITNDDSLVVYYVFQVIETTKEDLKPFVGKALVQRVEEKHEIVRETDDVIHFMDAWLPMIKYKRQQLESKSED